MSSPELRRVEVLARVKSKQLKLKEAAELMGVCYRQAKRLWKRYRKGGAKALKHANAGRRSNRAKPEKFRRQVLGLVRQKYSGTIGEWFGPTLAAEHLAEEDGLAIDAETLRRWMLARACGVAPANANRICSDGSVGRISGNWCSWTAAFMSGWRNAARALV